MSQRSHTQATDLEGMDETELEYKQQQQKQQQQTQMIDESVAVPSSSCVVLAFSSASDDAQAQRLARRSEERKQEVDRDVPERENRRQQSLTTKAAAREARRAAALAAQSAQWRSFGPAQRLFADGIAICLGLLTFKDFCSAAQTCKQWNQGARRVKSLGQTELTAPGFVLPWLLTSPFRYLLKSFINSVFVPTVCDSEHCTCNRFTGGPGRLKGLRTLSALTSLDFRLDLRRFVGVTPTHYPPRLITAKLELGCIDASEADTFDASSILSGFAASPSLTRLEMNLLEVRMDLTSLGTLKQLRHLAIDGFVELHYTAATLHVIKSLPLLESLALKYTADEAFADNSDVFEPEWLTPLLTTPHELQMLCAFDPDDLYLWDNDVCLQLLPSLIGLTELRCSGCSVAALPTLAAFIQLRVLHLPFESSLDFDLHEDNEEVAAAYDDSGFARLSVLVPHLARCNLTELCLKVATCDGASMWTLCASQPLLVVLRLTVVVLDSLQPLALLPQLTQLTVELASHSELPDLFDEICQCKMLQTLELANIEPPLTEVQKGRLHSQSSSAPLPLLRTFKYIVRDDADDE